MRQIRRPPSPARPDFVDQLGEALLVNEHSAPTAPTAQRETHRWRTTPTMGRRKTTAELTELGAEGQFSPVPTTTSSRSN